MIGGRDTRSGESVKYCCRYNIVTEKWQQLSHMLFAKADASACAINEYQIVVGGGTNSEGRTTDIVEIYDLRENIWKISTVHLNEPKK